jgi:hypothetical protein
MNYLRRVDMMNSKYARPEVKQVTKQWVRENCLNVTDRDLGLLKLIADRKLLRRDQIQALYPKFPSTDFLNKRLKTLYQKHLIDKIFPQVGLGMGSSKAHICLDRAGIIYLDMEDYNKPIKTDKNGMRSLPSGWEHTVAINDYECRIKEFFQGEHSVILKYWTELPHPYNDTFLKPDITFLVKHKGKGFLFFVEVDLGTEGMTQVKNKLDSYKDYYMSKRWINTEWARLFKTPVFPRVLFFTEDGRQKRIDSLREHIQDSSVRFHVDEHV